MAYTREQRKNAQVIVAIGRKMGASRRAIKAALAAGLVESNLRNVNYGDRDSLGVFQQRPSQGWGSPRQVRNVRYAAKQFYKRAIPLERKYNTGALAQAVQRSAFPGRYSQRGREAQDLLKRYYGGGGTDGGGPTARASGGGSVTVPGAKATTPVEPGGTGLVELLREIQGPPQPTPSAPLQAPAFSAAARVPTPAAYQPVQSSGGPGPPQSMLAEQLAAISQLRGPEPSPVQAPDTTVSLSGIEGGRSSRSGRARVVDGGGYAGTQKLAGAARRVARQMGAPIVSQKRDRVRTASGGISDHAKVNRRAWAVDIGARGATGRRLAKKIARTYGIKGNVIGTYNRHTINVNGRRYSVQILWNVPDHYDHVHVGFRRER